MFKTLLLTLLLLCLCSCETYTNTNYRTIAYQDAVNAGIPADKFVRQIDIESGFNPSAISQAGAVGIAQFMPETAQNLGIDPYDPIASLNGAAQLMASYQARYGDYKMALAAYNCGTGCLQNAINNYDYWWYGVPPETRNYINMIM